MYKMCVIMSHEGIVHVLMQKIDLKYFMEYSHTSWSICARSPTWVLTGWATSLHRPTFYSKGSDVTLPFLHLMIGMARMLRDTSECHRPWPPRHNCHVTNHVQRYIIQQHWPCSHSERYNYSRGHTNDCTNQNGSNK